MTSSYWVISEKLIHYILPAFIMISLAISFLLFSIWLSHYKKKAGFALLCLLLINVVIFFSVLIYTSNYRDLLPFITYKNRGFDVSVFKTTSYSDKFIKGYSPKDIEDTLHLPFYSLVEKDNLSSLEYLGKDEHLYFFQKDNIIYSVDANKQLLSFEGDNNQAVIIKEVYAELNDISYSELGFKKLVGPNIQKIIISKDNSEKTYHPTNKTTKLVDY
ncbi:MAG: hypothetical protein ACRCXQ_00565 [Vagococcus fluvialis]